MQYFLIDMEKVDPRPILGIVPNGNNKDTLMPINRPAINNPSANGIFVMAKDGTLTRVELIDELKSKLPSDNTKNRGLELQRVQRGIADLKKRFPTMHRPDYRDQMKALRNQLIQLQKDN